MRASLLLLFFFAFPAQAVTIEKPLEDHRQEQVAQTVFHQLKCVVCEGQALSESDAPLALQMRAHIRRMAASGMDAQAILDDFRARYGEHILLTPPLNAHTYLLWLMPLLLLLIGALLLWRQSVRKQP